MLPLKMADPDPFPVEIEARLMEAAQVSWRLQGFAVTVYRSTEGVMLAPDRPVAFEVQTKGSMLPGFHVNIPARGIGYWLHEKLFRWFCYGLDSPLRVFLDGIRRRPIA